MAAVECEWNTCRETQKDISGHFHLILWGMGRFAADLSNKGRKKKIPARRHVCRIRRMTSSLWFSKLDCSRPLLRILVDQQGRSAGWLLPVSPSRAWSENECGIWLEMFSCGIVAVILRARRADTSTSCLSVAGFTMHSYSFTTAWYCDLWYLCLYFLHIANEGATQWINGFQKHTFRFSISKFLLNVWVWMMCVWPVMTCPGCIPGICHLFGFSKPPKKSSKIK